MRVLTEEAFSIREEGKTENIISGGTYLSISSDHLTVTLHDVRTLAGRQYRLEIAPGKIQEMQATIPFWNQLEILALSSDKEASILHGIFSIESVESLGIDTIRATFQKILVTLMSSTFAEIWTMDALGSEKETSYSLRKERRNSITFTTDAQSSNALYYLLFPNRSKVLSIAEEVLGVPNSSGFWDILKIACALPQ